MIDFYQQQLKNLDELLKTRKITEEEYHKISSEIADQIIDLYKQLNQEDDDRSIT